MTTTGSLAGVFDRMRPHLPEALVPPPAFERLRALASTLPGTLTNRIYIECRLADGEERVDVVIGVHEPNRPVLQAASSVAFALPGLGVVDHPVWRGARRFCDAWSDAARPYRDGVHGIWLEFDLDASHAAGGDHVPGVFVSFDTSVLEGRMPVEAAIASLEIVKQRRLAPDVRRALVACLDRLESPAYLAYLGVMFPRGDEAVRVCVMGLGGDRLIAYLRAIGWPGSTAALSRQLDSLRCDDLPDPARTVAMLHFDVADRVGKRLGFEFCFDRRSQLGGRLLEDGVLRRLGALHLCSPSKREALHAWLGRSVETFDHECWPSVALRRVNHVKVTVEDGVLEAKTYLSVFYGALPGRRRLATGTTRIASRPRM